MKLLYRVVVLAALVFPVLSSVGALRYDISKIAHDLEIADVNRNPYLNLQDWMAEAPDAPASLSPDLTEAYYRSWATLWVNLQPPRGAWTHPIISPGANYMQGVWLWDSGFHILGLRHGHAKARQLALWQIEVMLSGQASDGRIPREVHTEGPLFLGTHGIQAPGILTLAANELLNAAADTRERQTVLTALADFYPKLVRNHDWYAANDDQGRGLSKWEGWDSGWDNSPRWDACGKESIDLNAWLYLDQTELARLAHSLGKLDDEKSWLARAETFKQKIRQYEWNEALGVFNDTACDGNVISLLTPAIYFPVWAGITTPAEATRAFAYLDSPQQFGTAYPLPSVAAGDAHFWEAGYWRGPTWVNLNWVVVQALKQQGRTAQAEALRDKTLEMVAKTKIPYEYYSALTGAPLGSKSYGWTAALFVDLALEKK